MKNIYKIIIMSLCFIIAGLVIIIVFNSVNSKKNPNDSAVVTESEEVTENVVQTSEEQTNDSEDVQSSEEETEKSDEADSDKSEEKTDKSASKKYAAYVTISDGGNWQDNGDYVYQYSIDIHNDSDEDLSGWEVRISGFSGGKIGDNWNGKYSIKGDTMNISCVDYNSTLPAHQVTNMGLQVKFKESSGGSSEKTPELYINGELYQTEKEEPTTQSKEEKEKSKKEKAEPEKGTPLENHGALSIDGTDIVDKDGKKYQLKGVSTHGLAWFPEYVNKESFKTFRDDWGANLIRLAMYTGESGGYCQDGNKDKLKKLVCDGVDFATELGMYVIVDWHILSDNNPLTNQDEAIAFFDEISAKYADYDNVLYEICNEPNGSTSWSDIKEYAESVIPVIRANDKDAIIIVGTPTWSQDVDMAAEDPIKGEENIAYTVHFYAATHKDNIRNKLRTAHDKGLAIFISEFSICDASGNGGIDYDSADEWFDLIDELNLSYAGWNLSNKDETSSLIAPDCKKTSGWSDDELSETGKWLKSKISE